MESTALMNSRSTRDINSQNIVMGDAWKRQKHYVTADTEIVGKNRVHVDLEIVNEY